MTDYTDPTRAPHRWVADRMGYSMAGVSLIRNGHRAPTLQTMEAVEAAFGWPICDQVEARADYAALFEEKVTQAYAEALTAGEG